MLMGEMVLSNDHRAIVRALIDAITLLSNRLNSDSSNSSLPPSLDPNRPRHVRKQSVGEKRKPGAQPGHEGWTFKRVPNPNAVHG
jgi:transposase